MMKIEEINRLYNKYITKAEIFFLKKQFGKSIHWLSFVANLLYEANLRFRDERLETLIFNLSQAMLFPCINFEPTRKYVFYDSFSYDNRGLAQQYLRALIDKNEDFLYITENLEFGSTKIYYELKSYSKAELYVVPNVGSCQKVRLIYDKILSYRPSKLFTHIKPWSIECIISFYALPPSITKYNINLTDHTYWAGVGMVDYNIEFRNYGATISIEKRNIKKEQILLLPFYPIVDRIPFAGFPIKNDEEKIILFFGGNLYKIIGNDNFFLRMIANILKLYQNCVCICCGSGDEGNMISFINNNHLKERWIYLGFRKDIFEIFRHCDIFINTYPIGGGLMTQYAAICSKPILSFGDIDNKGNFIESVLNTTKKITHTDEASFYQYLDKLITDKEFRISEGRSINKSVPTPKEFANAFVKLITTDTTQHEIVLNEIDYNAIIKRYAEIISSSDSIKIVLLKYIKLGMLFYRPRLLLWFVPFCMNKFKDKSFKNWIKHIFIYISMVLITPVRPFRLLFKGIHYLFRSIYSQWKRMEFKKAANDIIISYPLYLIGGKYIECGKCVFFGSYGILSTWDSFQGEKFTPHIVIGDHVTIGNGFHISAANKIIIGNGVLMGKYVTIVDNSHGNISFEEMCIPPINRHLQIENDVIIEDNVWIGDKVTIAKGVLIGCGSIIGSNSVITKDVPAYSVVAGVPAKIIRELNGK